MALIHFKPGEVITPNAAFREEFPELAKDYENVVVSYDTWVCDVGFKVYNKRTGKPNYIIASSEYFELGNPIWCE